MTIYAIFNEEGDPRGFFDTEFHDYELPEGAVEVTIEQREEFLTHSSGRRWINGEVVEYTPPPQPPPVPFSISDRQFFQQLAVAGIITQEDALAANAAVIPPPLLALIEQMPEGEQFSAKMILSGATTFERSHPMTIQIGTAYGMLPEQIDAFFIAAAKL